MRDGSGRDKKGGSNYKKLLNKEDPLDNLILELAEKGELKVKAVEVETESSQQQYSRSSLPSKGRRTS